MRALSKNAWCSSYRRPKRLNSPVSRTMTRSKDSSPSVCCSVSIPGRNERFRGAAWAQAGTQVLPSRRNIWAMPNAEPMQSPSGNSCASKAMLCAGCSRPSACWISIGSSCESKERASSLIASTARCLFILDLANKLKDSRTLFNRCIQLKNQLWHVT